MQKIGVDSFLYNFTDEYVPQNLTPAYSPDSLFSAAEPVFPVSDTQVSVFSSLPPLPMPLPNPSLCSFDSNAWFGGFDFSFPSFMDFFQMPFNFNFANFQMPTLNFPPLFPKLRTFAPVSSNSAAQGNFSFDTSVKADSLRAAGYNPTLGKMLAQDVASHAHSKSTGYCSKYVSNAMERLGIVGERGDAWELTGSLRRNPHFREIDPNTVNPKELPAGCVIVYPQGSAGYSRDYGHVEIALGNGKAASDFVNDDIKISSDMKIFAPVSA